jgi:hypothetical protein
MQQTECLINLITLYSSQGLFAIQVPPFNVDACRDSNPVSEKLLPKDFISFSSILYFAITHLLDKFEYKTKTIMKTLLMVVMICSVSVALAQWTTVGNDVYNTNSGNIGIGTTTPGTKLEVNGGGTLDVLNLLNESNSLGFNLRVSSGTDFHSSAITGRRSRGTLSSPSDVAAGDRITGLYGGMFVNGAFRNSAAIQFYVGSSPSSTSYPSNIRFETTSNLSTSRSERMRITEAGLVGINTSTPGFQLDVNGTIRAVSVIQTSDERFKTNIKPIKSALEKITALAGYSYQFKSENGQNFPKGVHFGLLAGETETIVPELVSRDPGGYLAVDYIGLIPLLIEAMKELSNDVQTRKNELIEALLITNQSEKKESLFELKQNTPNPTSAVSLIQYRLPRNTTGAKIIIHDLNGSQVKSYDLKPEEQGSIEIRTEELKAGIYLYTLFAEGMIVSTKKLLITK